MAQRILNVEYSLPDGCGVSGECCDLLRRILVRDPAHRIAMPAILQHPWVLRDLPPGVAEMNERQLAQGVPQDAFQACVCYLLP